MELDFWEFDLLKLIRSIDMPIINEAQERLRLAFPQSSDAPLFRAVQEGAYLADHLFDGESFLNNNIGRDLRGHIRRIGIAYQINRYCNLGDLPFMSEVKPMPHGNWHWLEIRGTGAVAHVCRSGDVEKFPREAESRQDYRLSLQPDLLNWTEGEKSISQIVSEIPKLYAWLTYRIAQDGKLSHLCWGAPAADYDEWIAHINVITAIASHDREEIHGKPIPDPREKLRFKEHVAKAIKSSEEQKRKA